MGLEHHMGLAGVPFEIYEGAIKRDGYTGRATDDSMKEVAGLISLSVSDFDDTDSFVA